MSTYTSPKAARGSRRGKGCEQYVCDRGGSGFTPVSVRINICPRTEESSMNRRTAGLSLYSCLTPMRWLKAAAAYAGQEVAELCSNHWRSSALMPAPIPAQVRRARVR